MTAVDQSELTALIQRLESSVERLTSNRHSDDDQCDVCLLTRSAYTEFFSVSVLEGEVPAQASGQLKGLFESILEILPENSPYRPSVHGRYHDFLKFCDDFVNRKEDDTDLSV